MVAVHRFFDWRALVDAEYCVPRLADCDHDHGCEKKFSSFREDPLLIAKSGSMALHVSRLPFPPAAICPLLAPLLRWRLKRMKDLDTNFPGSWEPQVKRE